MTGPRTIGARWPVWFVALITGVAVAWFALLMLRFAASSVSFDYDEGVYWQTVRAMAGGGTLYRNIFLSQPPLFTWIAEATYRALGETLLAARASIVLMALGGLGGALALGWAMAGRAGGLVALLARGSSWPLLRAGFVLQADGPSVMLHLPALAAALWWWRSPRAWLAIVCSAAVAASVAAKLLGVTILVPLVLVSIFALIDARSDAALLRRRLGHLGLAVLAALAVIGICLAPYLHDWHEPVRQVGTFHFDARVVDELTGLESTWAHLRELAPFVRANAGLCLAALAGSIAGFAARPRLTLLLVAFLVADIALLALQTPIFAHHFVLLMPPLAALAACVLLPFRFTARAVVALLAAVAVLAGQLAIAQTVEGLALRADKTTRTAVRQISRAVGPDELLVTDDQFVAGLADRDTPRWLVDTSWVRIQSGYLGVREFCDVIAEPNVAAVYLGSGRIDDMPEFLDCVAASYTLSASYGSGRELWVRPRP